MIKLLTFTMLTSISLTSLASVITCEAEENQYIQSGEVVVEIQGKVASLRSTFDEYVINRDNCTVKAGKRSALMVTCPAVSDDPRIIQLNLEGVFKSYIADNHTGMYMASLICDN